MATLRLIYTIYLRLVGAALLALAAILSAARADVVARGDAAAAPVWALVIALGLGLLLLVPWWQPYGLWKPGRRTDAVWVLPHSVVCAVLPFLATPFLSLPFLPSGLSVLVVDPVWTAILPALLISALIVPRVRGGGKRAAMKSQPDRRAEALAIAAGATGSAPKPARAARADARGEPAIPAIGPAMRLYVAADWAVLRLMGLGLLCLAYLLHALVGEGRIDAALGLTHGLDTRLATWAFAAFGLVMTVPALMPRAIARPRHVLGGVAKAVILVAGVVVLVEPLRMAIGTWAPDAYRAALLSTIPPLFRAIVGVAVTSVLLVAFFRQLGTLPAAEASREGPPAMALDDLRALRRARMG